MKELGTRIKRLREKKRWSQFVLGKKSKVSTTTVQRVEAGSDKVAYGTLFKIASALKVSVDYLKTGEEAKPPELTEVEEILQRLMEKMKKPAPLKVRIKGGKAREAEADELEIFLNSEDIPKVARETIFDTIKSLTTKYLKSKKDNK